MRLPRSLNVWKLGTVNYLEALKLQEKLVTERKAQKIGDTLLCLQHPPTYTLGKRRTEHNLLISESELRNIGAQLHYTERGGDITYHGPGQAVLYPILSLREIGLGARKYVEQLELTMIELASLYGVKASVGEKGETGVWVGDGKIGAIGVRISAGITSHGLAFNIDPDLNYFKNIVPCGIADKRVTSLREETGTQRSERFQIQISPPFFPPHMEKENGGFNGLGEAIVYSGKPKLEVSRSYTCVECNGRMVQENASVSSQDKSKRGPVMTDPELLDQLQLDEAKQIGRSSFAPDMLKPVSKRQKGTGNRGRAASKPGIYTRKRRRPEYPTIIVLGLRAHLPSDHKNPTPRRKSRRKVDKNEAAETRLVSAVSPKKDPSGPEVSKEAKSNNCEWRSELSLPPPPNDTVEDRDKEDQRLFLEVVEALQRVKPKRRRGRPKKVPTDQLMEVEIE